jgi:hypothetical protein
MADSELPRWLIVVRRDRRDLYEDLRRNFDGDGRVRVLLDRRERIRREARVPVGTERRRSDRRETPGTRDVSMWEDAGFRLYYRGEEMRVYER